MSESALTSIVTGMALNGHKPILEIMFGDFITLCADGLINHASKFVGLYDKPLNIVIRTPMGGFRGYGATHSQTIEKILFGIPNINIYATNILQDPGLTIVTALNSGNPSIVIENKSDYSRDIKYDNRFEVSYFKGNNVYYVHLNHDIVNDGYIIAYGGMVSTALEIIHDLYISTEKNLGLIVPILISPLHDFLIDNISAWLYDKELYVLEESNKQFGFGSEVSRLILENSIRTKNFKIFSAKGSAIPSSKDLEKEVLPSKESILKELING
jgi:pyruvate/2-oxoglutarate/acetoin dehydrogenase E1 component